MRKNCKRSYLPQESGKPIICALPQGLDVQIRLPVSINNLKMQAIRLGFKLHAEKYVDSSVVVSIDSIIAFSKH